VAACEVSSATETIEVASERELSGPLLSSSVSVSVGGTRRLMYGLGDKFQRRRSNL
jgi:hypothetical protein